MDIGDVSHTGDKNGKGNAEGHAADDKHGIHGARHARCGETVQYVTCRIDGRQSGHEEDGACNERVPQCTKSKCSGDGPRKYGGDKSGNHGAGVGIESILVAEAMCDEAHECRNGGDERLFPAPAEQLARAARADGSSERDAPMRVAECTCTDACDGVLGGSDGRVAAQDAPGKFAHGGENGEVHAVFHALAELRKGAFVVADVQHKRCVGNVGLDVFSRDAQVDCRAFHIADDACTVGTVLHQRLSNVQQELHFVVECLVVIVRHISNFFAPHSRILPSLFPYFSLMTLL